MVGQDADCHGLKWMPLLHDFVDVPKAIDFVDQEAVGPLCEDDGEEEHTAFGTNISRHNTLYCNLT